MKPKMEEFLYVLLWSADHLMRPTVRNLTDSFETWASRNGLHQRLARLEAKHWVEQVALSPNDRVYRLTEAGRLHALGGRDPAAEWARPWDGSWRMVVFDIPTARNSLRKQVRRYLQGRHFGRLQDSLWVTPNSVETEREVLRGAQIDVSSLILIEGRPCTHESDGQIVEAAWNWQQINAGYTQHLRLLEARPREALKHPAAAQAWLRWAGMEQMAWQKLMQRDPLLPERLLPAGYRGQEAWHRRLETLAQAQKAFPALSSRNPKAGPRGRKPGPSC